jgi:hypothetical protein
MYKEGGNLAQLLMYKQANRSNQGSSLDAAGSDGGDSLRVAFDRGPPDRRGAWKKPNPMEEQLSGGAREDRGMTFGKGA